MLRSGYSRRAIVVLTLMILAGGCAAPERIPTPADRGALRQRAWTGLSAAIRYPHNPAVRVQAVEALESARDEKALPLLRAALLDQHPAVRFAACTALGQLRDRAAEDRLRACAHDTNANVQVAALFALHRLGHEGQTGRMATYLLEDEDVAVRRNAAMVLGLMEEPGAIKLLARSMRDKEAGVRQHVLEAMARLGNPEAKRELTFLANTGIGADEVFALDALAQTGDAAYLATFRYKLQSATHLETKLAAARGLGMMGRDDGFSVALRALSVDSPVVQDVNDPVAGQRLRVKQLAAAALGAIGRAEALEPLGDMLEHSDDPRLQVSAARAILEILAADRGRALPFPSSRGKGPGV